MPAVIQVTAREMPTRFGLPIVRVVVSLGCDGSIHFPRRPIADLVPGVTEAVAYELLNYHRRRA